MRKIKKMLLCMLFLLSLTMIAPTQVEAAVKINKKTATLTVGKALQLKVSGTKSKVTWSSNKKSVATVTKKGKVTAKKKGTATITAKVGKKKYSCKVTVKAPAVKLSEKSKTLTVGQSFNLSLKNTKSSVKWSTSNKKVAAIKKVSKYKYKVTGRKSGTATITAKVGKKKYNCKVTVKAVENNNDQNITTGQKNALRAAKEYLKYMAFSYEGLIEQLQYDRYLKTEAVYAANNCGVDWNVQALKCAEEYLKYIPYSYSGLIEQLKYEKFTLEQAKYGVSHCKVNWSEQAVKMAKAYLKDIPYSKQGLIEQLKYDGFTREQADSAADNCGADWNAQAAKSAENYLKYSAYSKAELIEQLEYEGFTHSQAIYGVEANGY